MSILLPRLVALDSSHWAKWMAAYFSVDSRRRDVAQRFHRQLLDRSWIPFLSWHHFEELIGLDDEDVVQKRIMFLRNLSMIAWFQSVDDQSGVGSITDIVAAEAIACCEGLEEPHEIIRAVKSRLLRFGAGAEAIGNEDWVWHAIRNDILHHSEQSRAITAIAPFQSLDDTQTLGQLLKGKLTTPSEISKRFESIGANLTLEVGTRGDRRIKDPAGIATAFLETVIKMVGQPASVRDLVTSTYVKHGLELHELLGDMTVRELNELSSFRTSLQVVAPKTDHTFEELRERVRMERCPHWIIARDMQSHAPELPERKGSDLADGYLAVLAAYVDHLFVDKRTAENFRRLPQTCQTLSFINPVSKAGDFEQVLTKLAV